MGILILLSVCIYNVFGLKWEVKLMILENVFCLGNARFRKEGMSPLAFILYQRVVDFLPWGYYFHCSSPAVGEPLWLNSQSNLFHFAQIPLAANFK